jgi:predicted Zn-dependent protease
MRVRISLAVAAIAAIAAISAPAAFANHSWNGYHWARTANPFTIKLGDNVSGLWDGMLVTASSDWTQSTVLNTTIVTGGTRPKPCKATLGRVEVCSASYGNSGWLGVATIWLQSGTKHIVQGTVKNNDYYFGSSSYQYNNRAEMQHVICQEIGHTFGLDHQDESGISLNTCMDYYHNTSDSDVQSTHPNQHDYQELSTIYSHLDSTTTVGAPSHSRLVSLGQSGESKYVDRLRNGLTRITYVRWATPIHASL